MTATERPDFLALVPDAANDLPGVDSNDQARLRVLGTLGYLWPEIPADDSRWQTIYTLISSVYDDARELAGEDAADREWSRLMQGAVVAIGDTYGRGPGGDYFPLDSFPSVVECLHRTIEAGEAIIAQAQRQLRQHAELRERQLERYLGEVDADASLVSDGGAS